MNRRTIIIILLAVAFALLVGFLWYWFFTGDAAAPQNNGSFGTGTDRPGGSTGSGTTGGNIPANVLPGQGGNTASGPVTGTSDGGTTGGSIGTIGQTPVVDTVPGVDWLGGGSGGGLSGAPTTNFVPSPINQLNNGSVGGSPTILPNLPGGSDGSGTGLGLAGLFGAGAGCALYAAFQGAGAAEAGSTAAAGSVLNVFVMDVSANRKLATKEAESIGDCLARTIGKAMLQQITNSIVNWINSGFNGQPSFVKNFEQFFANVGDQAAGEFIRGSGLSFLCSPFQSQVKIAVAQSYARRSAQSCTLSGIVRNVSGFMNGNFSQGGWRGLVQMTTMPTNNPYGAYAYAQAGLVTAQNRALANANRNISPGGFISIQKCDPPGSQNCKVSTPGAVIEQSLNTTLGTSFRQLELAKSFDEIINALISQLMVKTLYNGLGSLSGQNGYAANYLTPEQQQAQVTAQTMLTDMQGRVQVAQQYGSVQQGSITDIQGTQQRIQEVANCWEIASSSPELTASKQQTAQANAQAALAELASYEAQIAVHNNNVMKANTAIAALQELQTQTLGVSSAGDVSNVQAAYSTAIASGALISPAEVTNAQQNRAALQSSLAAHNQKIAADLQTCHAFR